MKINKINTYINNNLSCNNPHTNKKAMYSNIKQSNSQKLSFGSLAEIPVKILQFYGVMAGCFGCIAGASFLTNKIGDWFDKISIANYEKKMQKENEYSDLQKLK